MFINKLTLISKLLNLIFNQSRSVKTLVALFIDLGCCIFSVWISYYLRLGEFVSLSENILNALFYSIIISFPIFIFFDLYKTIFRYSGINTIFQVSKAIIFYAIIYAFLIVFIGIEGIPRTIGLIQPLIFWILIIAWRIFPRKIINRFLDNKKTYNSSNALIYGAGEAGIQLVRAMQESRDIFIKGFLDDNLKQQGCIIEGKQIYSPKVLDKLIKEKKINLILLALPSVSITKRSRIIKNLLKFKVQVRTIPGIDDLAKGNSLITDFLELNIDDLLGRIQVEPYEKLMKRNIFGKTIMVTGAGGSIGSELCRQIIRYGPRRILLIELSEYALYLIHSELENLNNELIEVIPLIASVQDSRRISEILSIWHPETIYHTAAYKHVPIVEHNLAEGLKNNLFGTFDFAKISLQFKVPNFVFVSTDKAVRPTNIMGATKRLAELSLQALNDKVSTDKDKRTKFSIVRFGNVLDSSGSVIPKFRDQIKNGGPITLTHKDITRYFMTITEASQLVIQAGAMAEGGDVFVLDMGEPIKIYDLAKRMIELSGKSLLSKKNMQGNIEIKITGLRPGEKLYEELLLSDNPIKTEHPKIFRSQEPFIKFKILIEELDNLNKLINKNDLDNIVLKLKSLVADYYPNSEIVDYTYIKKPYI